MKPKQPSAQQLALFQQAASLQQSGRFSEAVAAYQKLLQDFPQDTQLWNQLGMLALQQGNFSHGIELLAKSLAIAPNQIDIELNRGIALALLHRHQEAVAGYEKVISLKPDYAEAYYHRGKALHELQQLPAALSSYDRAIAIKPNFAAAYLHRGITLKHLLQFEAALASYEKAIALQTDFAAAYYNRGILLQEQQQFQAALASYDQAIAIQADFADAYNNRGLVLMELQQYPAALASFDSSLALNPSQAQAYYNRGLVLDKKRDFAQAIASYDHAIALNADFAEAYNNRGLDLHELQQYSAALASFDRSLTLKPDQAEVYLNRAICLKDQHRNEEAVANCNRAIELKADFADAYWHKALLKLLTGDYREGWRLYEWRWQGIKRDHVRSFSQPQWLGETSIAGKTLLIHAEQGLGDFLQFCRFFPLLTELGAVIVIEVPSALMSLASTIKGQIRLVEQGHKLPDFDLHCPIMSLALAFKTTLETVPSQVPYLFTDAKRQEFWQQRLGEKTRPRIGIVWSGSATDPKRSIPLMLLAPLLSLPCDFHSLQKQISADDATASSQFSHLHRHETWLSDFAETAALADNMDLILSIDTSVAHLAGALGKPVWILLRYNADYRWLLDRNDSPWYPTATLFRQPATEDWSSLIIELSQKLQIHLLSSGQ